MPVFPWLSLFLCISLKVTGQTIVWDDYRDLCVFYDDKNMREPSRCEKSQNIMFEKRLQRDDEPFWCILVNNTALQYKKLEIVFSGRKSTRKSDYGQYWYTQVMYTGGDDNTEIYNISRSIMPIFTFYPVTYFYELQNVMSIKLNGEEMCLPLNSSEPDKIYPNKNYSNQHRTSLRYFKKCRWIASRLHRPPNRCELLSQIIFEEMSLNGQELFYCIIVDRTKSLYPVNESNLLNVELSNENYISMWTSKNKRLLFDASSRTNMTFNLTTGVFYLTVAPLTTLDNIFPNVLSIKLNNRESCRLRIDPNEEFITCGMRQIKHQGLITYGKKTYHGKYPWHVALYQLTNSGQQNYICGGSIISENAILTAAHCVQNSIGVKTPDTLRVQAGKYDLSISNADTKEYRVAKVIVHFDFEISYLENDIALLKLENFISYSNYIQPICINGYQEVYQNRMGFVPGWGKNEMEIQNAELHEAAMPIVAHQECRRSKRSFFSQFLTERNFCAGLRNGTSVCDGDSGGGLVFELETGWHLKGLVSLGVATPDLRCDVVEYVIFTDVTKYFDWIYNNIIVLVN